MRSRFFKLEKWEIPDVIDNGKLAVSKWKRKLNDCPGRRLWTISSDWQAWAARGFLWKQVVLASCRWSERPRVIFWFPPNCHRCLLTNKTIQTTVSGSTEVQVSGNVLMYILFFNSLFSLWVLFLCMNSRINVTLRSSVALFFCPIYDWLPPYKN